MRRLLLGGACLLAALLAWRLAPTGAQADDEPGIAAAGAHLHGNIVARGAYLAHMADCEACHLATGQTPSGVGASQKLSGGRPFATPFGTIYAPNITPDEATGIGGYTDDEWVSALRRGVGRGGKHLYPAMPYTNYTLMTRGDTLAIKAYLMTQPAVRSEAPANRMSFPFNIRFLMVFWNLLNNPDHVFKPDASRDAAWNRGAYLAEALGHCQQCHTPRNIIQGLKSGQAYAGAVQQGWVAYNMTSAQAGIGGWSAKDLAAYLSTGRADGHGVAAGPMAEAVSYSLRYLSADDAAALAAYVKSIPARQVGSPDAAASGEPVQEALGQRLYQGACASCHRPNGTGVQSGYAALLGDQSVADPIGHNLLQMMLRGGTIATSDGIIGMPAFSTGYTDTELAAVANYTVSQLSHVQGRVSAEQVGKLRATAPGS